MKRPKEVVWWAKDTLFAFSKDSPFTLANRILIPGYVSCWGFFSLKEGGTRSGLECGMTQFWPKRCNRKCAEGPLGKSYSWSEESSWLERNWTLWSPWFFASESHSVMTRSVADILSCWREGQEHLEIPTQSPDIIDQPTWAATHLETPWCIRKRTSYWLGHSYSCLLLLVANGIHDWWQVHGTSSFSGCLKQCSGRVAQNDAEMSSSLSGAWDDMLRILAVFFRQ